MNPILRQFSEYKEKIGVAYEDVMPRRARGVTALITSSNLNVLSALSGQHGVVAKEQFIAALKKRAQIKRDRRPESRIRPEKNVKSG